MLTLVPQWAHDYLEFWNTIQRRNFWFIKIRYIASASLIALLLIGTYVLEFQFSSVQVYAIIITAITILSYNVIIHYAAGKVGMNPDKFNIMHLSLIQTILDLITLLLLVYYTGTIESPLYMFFIFHMVIGSLVLPSYLIWFICLLVICSYSLLIYLQRADIIYTHIIAGITSRIEKPWTYDLLFILIFSAMMVITVMIANRISGNLLKREEELRQTLIKLDESEKSKQKYLMGVVHEIKTPFSAIKSMIDLLLQKYLGPVDEKVAEKLTRIRHRTDEGLYLINNILKISKLKLLEKTEKTKIYPGEIISEYLEQHSEEFKKKNINVRFDDNRRIRKPIEGDEELVQLVFSNVLSNALKYVEENGRIVICIDHEEECIRFRISDNGIGIPKKDRSRIFDQFYRASNTKRSSIEGSGLGLSLVKEIILHHQGSIDAESPCEIGTETRPGAAFIIRLPYITDESTHKPTLQPLSGGL